jgi:hypothetical protein
MKQPAANPRGLVIAAALTWDGARWPARRLPAKARAFLAGKSKHAALPSRHKISRLFEENKVREIRICWVPRLKGGSDVLSDPFTTGTGKRLAFRSVKTIRFGDVLGVVYRRKT